MAFLKTQGLNRGNIVEHFKRNLTKPFAQDSSHFHKNNVRNSKGMTLIEILIVIALLGTLMAILVTNLSDTSERAKEDQARIAMGTIAQSLQLYRVHNNKYPTTAQGLDALVSNPGDSKRWRGPYIEKEKLNDPWGSPFDYTSDGRKYEIVSAGSDSTMGTEKDIYYPERETEEQQQ